jgi:hypothetical protein
MGVGLARVRLVLAFSFRLAFPVVAHSVGRVLEAYSLVEHPSLHRKKFGWIDLRPLPSLDFGRLLLLFVGRWRDPARLAGGTAGSPSY